MSSNIKLNRICQHCRKEFIARTTVTKYCSHNCSQRAYKARKRAEKVEQSNIETEQIKNQSIEQLKAKEFLNINEVCLLLGISRRTVYRMFEQGDLNKIKIGSRTLIKRAALNRLLSSNESGNPEIPEQQLKDLEKWNQTGAFDVNECYTLKEVQEKYGISEKALYEVIKRNDIPKMKKGWYAYVPKPLIDNILT